MQRRITPSLYLTCLLSAFGCTRPEPTIQEIRTTLPIPISEVTINLPEHPDKNLVMANCLPCHSLAYIANQPPMKREGWKKTVRKMIDVYGAPIADSATVDQITDYLFYIRKGE